MKHYDVAIIGGGIIGCACAWYLAKAGVSCVLIEREQINAGASGRNAGSLHFQLEYRLIQNETALQEQLPALIPLTLAAIKQWRGLEQELGESVGLGMKGGLMVAETPAEIARLERKSTIENRYGLPVELLTGNEARELAPYLSERVQAALLCRDEGHCNPRLLTPALARAASKSGAELLMQRDVAALTRVDDHWQIHSSVPHAKGDSQEAFSATKVINASGAWAGRIGTLANVHLPVFPVGLMMSVTEPAQLFMGHLIQHAGRKLSLKQTYDGNLLIGGGWSARQKVTEGQWPRSTDAQIDLNLLKQNISTAVEVVPAVGRLHLLRTWTGITGVTPDQLPLVGRVSQVPDFYVAAGGSGFTYGPIYAQLLCQEILEEIPVDALKPYSPGRFDHMNMFMGQHG